MLKIRVERYGYMSASDSEVAPDADVETVDGIGPSRGETLRANGYETVADLQDTSLGELTQILPSNVAQSVKSQVGDGAPADVSERLTTAAQAREEAQKIAGAKAKTVKGPDGKQRPKVLRKVDESHEDGATVEIHKG